MSGVSGSEGSGNIRAEFVEQNDPKAKLGTKKLFLKVLPKLKADSPLIRVDRGMIPKGLKVFGESYVPCKVSVKNKSGQFNEALIRLRKSDLDELGQSLGMNIREKIITTMKAQGKSFKTISDQALGQITGAILKEIVDGFGAAKNFSMTGSLRMPVECTVFSGNLEIELEITEEDHAAGVIDWAKGDDTTSLVLDYSGHNKPGEIEPYRDAMEACFKALSEWEPDFSLDGTVNYQELLEGMKPFAELFGDRQGIEKLQVGNSQLVQAIYQCLKGLDSSNVSESSVKLQKALKEWGEYGGSLSGIRLGKFESYLKAELYGKQKKLPSEAAPLYRAAFEIAKFCEQMFTKLKNDSSNDFKDLLFDWAEGSLPNLGKIEGEFDAGFMIDSMRKFLFVGMSVAPGLAFTKIWESNEKPGHYHMLFLNMGDGGVVVQRPGKPPECLTIRESASSNGPAGVGNVANALKNDVQILRNLPPGTVIASFSDGLGEFLSWPEIQEVLRETQYEPKSSNFMQKVEQREGEPPLKAQNFKESCKDLKMAQPHELDDISIGILLVPRSQESEA